jgi:hypothetical protein
MQAFANGTQGNIFEHEEIKGTVRAVVRCTGALFKKFVEEPFWQTRISWFEERPAFETFSNTMQAFSVSALGPISSPPADAPTVCVIDTGLTIGNPFLSPIVKEGYSRSFLRNSDDASDGFGHGSGVASLVGYYALNLSSEGANEGLVWVAGARVLNERNELEDERLFSALLRQAVEHFAPLGIRIFNLSVNDRVLGWNEAAKRTVPRRSWTARTIDQLSKKWDVVFVVSTGNLPEADINHFLKRGQPYPSYLSADGACIHDPAQSALAVTVGSVAHSTLIVGPKGKMRAIAERDYPSPFARVGPGIRGEVKPELVDYGGNYAFDEDLNRVLVNAGLKIAVASNQLTPAVAYDLGSSFAAARVSHKLARILSDLQLLSVKPSASLLKAFLVNSARHLIRDELSQFQSSFSSDDLFQWMQVLGYGTPDYQRATDCDEHSVVMFFQGDLKPDPAAFFEIPVPATLKDADHGKKRLTVTLAALPEIQRWGLEEYLGTNFKWRMFRGDVSRDLVVAQMADSEVADAESANLVTQKKEEDSLKELKFQYGVNRRSRGTVQHDVAEWTYHRAEYSDNHYTLAVAAYERWGRTNPDPVPFAVVVRLEDDTGTANVYAEVRAALATLEARVQGSATS